MENTVRKIFSLIKNRFGNVENKSSATIRSEITKQNVIDALGYTPGTSSTEPITYTLSKEGSTIKLTSSSGTSSSVTDSNTTYSAGDGISLSGTTFSNSGVRSVSSGSANGTISVNTNGTSANVAVKGLGSAAYTNSTAYDTKGSADTALTNAKNYTDEKIDAIVGEGASTTLDTIGEISKAIEEHKDVTDALNSAIGNKVDKVSGKGLSTNDLTSTLKTNYDTAYTHSQSAHAPSNAEANQNAFSNIVVGSTTIAADSKTDSLTLAGSNVTITPDATNDKVTIGITKDNVTTALGYTPPTTDTKYTHPTSGVTAGTYRSVTVNAQGHVTAGSNPTTTIAQGGTGGTTANEAQYNLLNGMPERTAELTDNDYSMVSLATPSASAGMLAKFKLPILWDYVKSKISSVLGLTATSYGGNAASATKVNGHTVNSDVPSGAKFTDTTYSAATTNADGLMSTSDKTKLNGIATNANNYSHPTTAGNKHIPSGGSSGQILRWNADGTAIWGNENVSDTKVTNELATTTKAYLTGTTSATTNTGTQVFDTGVYLGTKAGELNVGSLKATNEISLYRKSGSTVGSKSIAAGFETTASGSYSCALGQNTTASGISSYAEGSNTLASWNCAHAEGYNTKASSNYQHVQGKYNIEDTADKYAHIVGGGSSDSNRKNIHTLDWDGNAEFAGDVIATNADGNQVSLSGLGAELVSDLLAEAEKGVNARRIVRCDKNTLNTPYTDGVINTELVNAIAYIDMVSVTEGLGGKVRYISFESQHSFINQHVNGAWTGWIVEGSGLSVVTTDIAQWVDARANGTHGFFRLAGSYSDCGTLGIEFTYTTGYYMKNTNDTTRITVFGRGSSQTITKVKYNGGAWTDWVDEFEKARTYSVWVDAGTDSWANILNAAKSEIMFVLKATIGNNRECLTITVPKASIDNTKTYYSTGYYYTNSAYMLAQVQLSLTSLSAPKLYKNGTALTTDYKVYYR